LLQAAADNRPHAADLIVSWGHGPAGHFGGNPAPGVWLMGGGQRLLARSAEGVLAIDLAACNAYDAAAVAPRVTCPTLLLLGGKDRMTPPGKGKALAAALRKAETVILPDAGHMLMGEAPDAVIDALLRFV
jgi:pimeloyl-ACP methyl ester carboxylesterase